MCQAAPQCALNLGIPRQDLKCCRCNVIFLLNIPSTVCHDNSLRFAVDDYLGILSKWDCVFIKIPTKTQ